MFFSSWYSVLQVIVVGAAGYVGLLVLFQISGKRSLSKFNGSELVVTVAFGSIIASGMLSPGVSVIDVIAAIAVLLVLQFLVTWSSMKWGAVERLQLQPRLLYHRGSFLERSMREERIGREEILAAMRRHGKGTTDLVEAVVLEANGSLSVIVEAGSGMSTLVRVQGFESPAGSSSGDSQRSATEL
jgi:uncharacterized membrane protein YcaP (DUF421 family)